MKKHLFFTLILALTLTFILNIPVFAEETDNMVNSGETTNVDDEIMPLTSSPSDGSASSSSDGPIGTGVNSDDLNQNSSAIECLEENCPDTDTIEHEGLSGEPEVVCAEEDESDCESTNHPEDDETALWPVYVSLGALGAMIILVIIINLIGSRKHKK